MKAIKTTLYIAIATFLTACGGKGNMQFGDNEFPVVTVQPTNA